MKFIYFLISTILFTSCATIIGGAKYNAKIKVDNHPNAVMYVNGQKIGRGEAVLKVKRVDADKLKITVKEEGCQDYVKSFTSKVIRPLAVVEIVSDVYSLGSSVANGNITLPLSSIINFLAGASWKPDVKQY